jgi:hypothetical protein
MYEGTIPYVNYVQGRVDQAIASVLIILTSKFGPISKELKRQIRNMDDLMKINKLLRRAVLFNSVDEVKKFL